MSSHETDECCVLRLLLFKQTQAATLESKLSRENATLQDLMIRRPRIKDTWILVEGAGLVSLVANGAVHEWAGAVRVCSVLELCLVSLGVFLLSLRSRHRVVT